MAGMKIGYIRVSRVEQNLDRQVDLLESNYRLDKLFQEKESGKNAKDRPVLQNVLAFLREGDTLIVASIDRLGRSLIDLNTIVQKLNDKGVSVHFLKENLLFDASSNDAMSKLLFNMMSSFAEFERELLLERQREGIKAAQARGVQFGRKHKLNDEQCQEIALKASSGANKSDLAKEYSIGRQALYNAIKRAA